MKDQSIKRFDFDAKSKQWLRPLNDADFPNRELKELFDATWRAVLRTTRSESSVSHVRIDIGFAEDVETNSGQLLDSFASLLASVLSSQVRVQTITGEKFFIACERVMPVDSNSELEKVGLAELFVGGELEPLKYQYSAATDSLKENTHNRERSVRKMLFHKFADEIRAEIRSAASRRFSADESGFRESAETINAIHRNAALSGGQLTYQKTPVFLKRELPPTAMNGHAVISICRVVDGSKVKTVDYIPSLDLKACTDSTATTVGETEILRQVEIETLRRTLFDLIGRRAGSPEVAIEIRNRINREKSRLNTALAYSLNGVLTKSVLITGRSSFQLKRTANPQNRILSSVLFPHLYLIDLSDRE